MRLGAAEIDDFKLGSSQVEAMFLGVDKVWPLGFDYPASNLVDYFSGNGDIDGREPDTGNPWHLVYRSLDTVSSYAHGSGIAVSYTGKNSCRVTIGVRTLYSNPYYAGEVGVLVRGNLDADGFFLGTDSNNGTDVEINEVNGGSTTRRAYATDIYFPRQGSYEIEGKDNGSLMSVEVSTDSGQLLTCNSAVHAGNLWQGISSSDDDTYARIEDVTSYNY